MSGLASFCRLSLKSPLVRAAFVPNLKCSFQRWKQLQPNSLGAFRRTCISAASSQEHGNNGDPGSSRLVYMGTIRSTVKIVKGLSLTTSLIGIMAQPFLLQQLDGSSKLAMAFVTAFASFFIFVTPLLLHYITKRYVTELTFDHNTKVFSATTLTLLNRRSQFNFVAEDVKVPDVPGPFTTFLAKGRPLFVDVRDFEDIDALEHLMGYDKPINWHLTPNGKQGCKEGSVKKGFSGHDKM